MITQNTMADVHFRRRTIPTVYRSIHCDLCNKDLAGLPAVTETRWKGDNEPPEWEGDYGAR